MDREQARFILRSYRPDGPDAADPDFAEALKIAAADPELAAWLEFERLFDGELAEAIAALPVPGRLRADILAGLDADRAGHPQAEDQLDAAMIGALAAIQPPATLRLEALAAMERSAAATRVPGHGLWRWAGAPLAAAAGVMLALFLIRMNAPDAGNQTALEASAPVPIELVQAGFLQTFTMPFFSVDQPRESVVGMPVKELTALKLPCPGRLPAGLQGLETVGCRELVIDGKRGALVCFDEPLNGTVHLVVFRREDVCGDLPCHKAPDFAQHGHFAVAKWCDGRHVFILLGTTEIDRLAKLF
jgi:hypothetical protein